MCPADCRFAELNVPVGRALCATERDSGAVGSSCSDEPNFLANVAPGSDLETAGQELERSVSGSPIPDRGAFNGISNRIRRLIGGLVTVSY